MLIKVDKPPEPIGGIEAIQQNIVYPEPARRSGVEGRVLLECFIDEYGVVRKINIIEGIGSGCDEEAMRVIKNTKFIPGRHGNKDVKVRTYIPIVFKLSPGDAKTELDK